MADRGWKEQLKKGLRGVGLELQRFDPDRTFAKRRQRRLEAERVDLALDVGAHAGEFGQALRHGGYTEKIISFEPVGAHYERLQSLASADGAWNCLRVAIGDHEGMAEINISGNDGLSSSLREMTDRHETGDPSSVFVHSERIAMLTLDQAMSDLLDPTDRCFLKIDTQGYELEVIAGASNLLERCRLLELELGLAELYVGQPLFDEMIDEMREHEMLLVDIEPGFQDVNSGELLQVDALFARAPEAQGGPG